MITTTITASQHNGRQVVSVSIAISIYQDTHGSIHWIAYPFFTYITLKFFPSIFHLVFQRFGLAFFSALIEHFDLQHFIH